MKSDADTIRSFLFWLLEQFSPTVSSPSGNAADIDAMAAQGEPLETYLEGLGAAPSYQVSSPSSAASSTYSEVDMPPLSELGEMPAVQDHFQALLKRRLEVEINAHPPLFPWESELCEYPVEGSPAIAPTWLAQLRSLKLPTVLPDDVLTTLLAQCQALVHESLQPGVQLVRAVETLFAEQPQTVEQIAGLVLTASAARSPELKDFRDLQGAFPQGFLGANPQQQVTLAMLAARDILDTLTLRVTPDSRAVSREWLTNAGILSLVVTHQDGTPDHLQIQVAIPEAGRITLPSVGQTVNQNRPGTLRLSLLDPQPGQAYPLEISLAEDQHPLSFSLVWQG